MLTHTGQGAFVRKLFMNVNWIFSTDSDMFNSYLFWDKAMFVKLDDSGKHNNLHEFLM